MSNDDVLSGLESQRLRTFCTSNTFSANDLDDFAILLQNKGVKEVRSNFETRVEGSDIAKARQDIAALQYGPTKIPVFNYLLQLTILNAAARDRYVQVARYLALEAKVPVDTPDLSGTTTFMYSISTKPYWDKEFAEIMLDGGAQVNRRNRYGCTAAHDIVMVRDLSAEGKMKAINALTFFVEKGGDLDIKDGDELSARAVGRSAMRIMSELAAIINPASGNPSMAGTGTGAGTGTTAGPKIGRNDPCRCGSKMKYKVCCGKN